MTQHFEDLWENCEGWHQKTIANETPEQIFEELALKINLYTTLHQKIGSIPEAERQMVKSHTLGEILLTLTKLSLKEDINVYGALGIALQRRAG